MYRFLGIDFWIIDFKCIDFRLLRSPIGKILSLLNNSTDITFVLYILSYRLWDYALFDIDVLLLLTSNPFIQPRRLITIYPMELLSVLQGEGNE